MKTALVTSIGSFSGDVVLRSLRSCGFRIVGTNCYPFLWTPNATIVDAFYKVPRSTEREFGEAIEHIVNSENVNYIIPLTDIDVDYLDGHYDHFVKKGIKPCISSHQTIRLCRDKKLSNDICESLNMKIRPIEYYSKEEFDRRPFFPAICKPRDGRSSEGQKRVYDYLDWEYFKKSIDNNYMIQPIIEGTVICLDIIRNPKDNQCVVVPREELVRTHNGAGLSVRLFHDNCIESDCIELANKLDVSGCVNFEVIKNPKGEYFFLECNPRFSAGVEYTHLAGYDAVKNSMRVFEGYSIDRFMVPEELYMVKQYKTFIMKKSWGDDPIRLQGGTQLLT